MSIDTIYNIGQIVFLKTDIDQRPRMVIQFTVALNSIQYNLVFGTENTWHFDFEIAEEKDVLKSL